LAVELRRLYAKRNRVSTMRPARRFTYRASVPFAAAVGDEPQPFEFALKTAGGGDLGLERAENGLDLHVTFQIAAVSRVGALVKGDAVLRGFFPQSVSGGVTGWSRARSVKRRSLGRW